MDVRNIYSTIAMVHFAIARCDNIIPVLVLSIDIHHYSVCKKHLVFATYKVSRVQSHRVLYNDSVAKSHSRLRMEPKIVSYLIFIHFHPVGYPIVINLKGSLHCERRRFGYCENGHRCL